MKTLTDDCSRYRVVALAAICFALLTRFDGCPRRAAIAEEVAQRATIERYAPTVDYVKRGRYLLSYDGRTRQARWVLESLDAKALKAVVARKDSFRPDEEFPVEFRATLKDYAGSGYDRGHLAPSADYRLTEDDQRATFVLSNMSPQVPKFNRDIWRKLESHVRDLADSPGVTVYCVTVPLWIPDKGGKITVKTIGENTVWVPSHCGKAILVRWPTGKFTMQAWILPNAASDKDLSEFRVSTDEFERRAGIDVWSALDDETENRLEAWK